MIAVLRRILSCFLFAVVVLAGFGPADFFQDLPRTLFFFSSIVVIFRLSGSQVALKKGKEQGESDSLFVLLLVLTFAAGFFIPFFAGRKIFDLNIPSFLRYLGLFCVHAGMFIRLVAVRTLKRQFSIYVAIQENHQLITNGIYSQIRHPIYLGAFLTLTGFALIFPTLPGFLFVFIYSMLLGHRMTQEERLMLKHFGSVYEEYISKSYRLIPHIY
jgi:protein-S-isoprenylcysteine O-methyltransferase Ste14